MVAYSFKKRFREPIENGTKPQTMRNERARHARPGEEVQLYTGMRTKHCRPIGFAICTAVTPVRIDFKRCHITIAGRPRISGLPNLDAFAVKDGFSSWADMRLFWMTEHGAITSWAGVLIEWDPLSMMAFRIKTKEK